MNKVFLIVIFIIFDLNAALNPETIISLESVSNRGKSIKKEIMLIKDSKVIVNRETLSPVEIINQSENIKILSTFLRSEIGARCEMGTFKHLYNKGKEHREEYGCLYSKRFNALEKSFKQLKKDITMEMAK